ncbi:hypothetical protein E2C01_024307 [Portunus trituberculatus]|uniref:Uncharacterized protein n=1 Tax=Portunus trituberculatus TaxID=210409 RepID=A0A5B7EA98_PORTR|nr:hypothetical protein [Portunus trituberculatus]
MKKIITKEKINDYLDTQSSSNIPPRARAESPGESSNSSIKSTSASPEGDKTRVEIFTHTSTNTY